MAADLPGERAPAKVNLFLHIRGRRADGYHLLDSLAVFPGIGDHLWVEPAETLGLSIGGPFGDVLPVTDDNLVLRAAQGIAAAHGVTGGAALRLQKNLPVASGIGGGSSDAAAALRLLSRHWQVGVPAGLDLSLGADVPVCMSCQPQFMGGIGENLTLAPPLPEAWMVLVNPLVSVSTGAVFNALPSRDNPAGPAIPAGGFGDFDDFIGWLHQQRNDMEAAAVSLCPPIAEVLAALSPAPLARMSGSGATCFALLPTPEAATRLAEEIRAAHQGWWVADAPMQAAG
ncbi:4-(cytidine 5'-diphospho)-2-C-methyl-D-erythritol kinase [Rhodobacteraceae bacterium NNCM2]|nr:4-(cytidine 5'-diphospho)-2-C-methyl-D-erythritol kinase [Coraliihabitans acroporae]